MFTKRLKTVNRGTIVETKDNTQIVLVDHQDLYEVCYVDNNIESITNLETKQVFKNLT